MTKFTQGQLLIITGSMQGKTSLKGPPSDRLLAGLHQAFLDHGYERTTMGTLAAACDVARRTLYYHFRDKEDAFRAMLRWQHTGEIAAGMEAGNRAVAEGGSVLDAIVAIMDVRFGNTRRELDRSPHAVEINYAAFRRFRDVMADSAEVLQGRLADFLQQLERQDLLRLRRDISPAMAAQLLCDGARGVNQTLPPRPALTLAERYRPMFAVILRGCTLPRPRA
jgi:AcrR family transcriptional regulator